MIRLIIQLPLCLMMLIAGVKSDSITLSQNQMLQHFQNDGSYQQQVAYYEASAAWSLYQSNLQLEWLRRAARLEHPQAAWRYSEHLSQLGRLGDARTWQKKAIALGQNDALLNQLKDFVLDANWSAANALKQNYSTRFDIIQLDKSIPKSNHITNLFDAIEMADQISSDELYGWQTSFEPTVENCRYDIGVIVSTPAQKSRFNGMIEEFYHLIPEAKEAFCFKEPVWDYRTLAICQIDDLERGACTTKGLNVLVNEHGLNEASHLITMTNQGIENVRGQHIYLNKGSTTQILIHEIGHWVGLIDEYQIRDEQQALLCVSDEVQKLGKNLIIAPKQMTRESVLLNAQKLGLLNGKEQLTPVETCHGTETQAYKRYTYLSPMQYLDVTPPDDFWRYYTE